MLAVHTRINSSSLCRQCIRKLNSSSRTIAEGDRVLLRHVKNEFKTPVFTRPLRPGGKLIGHYGSLDHDDIIGKTPRDIVTSSSGKELRVFVPTLEDYVTLTPRLVTPVYPADANFIVSLLDIHASPPTSPGGDEQIQILEAGTGHGALTLYLARAIHASNPLLPQEVFERLDANLKERLRQDAGVQMTKPTSEAEEGTESSPTTLPETNSNAETTLPTAEQWKTQRGAVIHTLDISSKHSHLAQKNLYGFRRGMYAGDVNFHIGDLSDWIDQRLDAKKGEDQQSSADSPFLSHVILDLPGSDRHIEKVASALHIDGKLIVFNPSLTQIASCVEVIRKLKLPLFLDNVVETGPSMTGGRDWDVRAVRPRALMKAEMERNVPLGAKDATPNADEVGTNTSVENDEAEFEKQDGEQARLPEEEPTGWEMVCRPKVGHRMIAGGFLGVFTKMKHRNL